jgi:hypothetical protein
VLSKATVFCLKDARLVDSLPQESFRVSGWSVALICLGKIIGARLQFHLRNTPSSPMIDEIEVARVGLFRAQVNQ